MLPVTLLRAKNKNPYLIYREEVIKVPYEYKSYFLHSKEVTLKGGRKQRIYWFSKADKRRPELQLDEVPAGYIVKENPKTGLPFLKKG